MTDLFARHRLIPGWDQDRLSGAAACVMGVGALGTEAARILAKVGFGRIILCDPDRIEASNIPRLAFARPSDVGRPKADSVAAAIRELVPDCKLDARPARFQAAVGLAELREVDVVLGCLDNHAARLDLAARCNLVGARYIDGGTHPWGGEVRSFLGHGGGCYGCSHMGSTTATTRRISCLEDDAPGPAAAHLGTAALVAAWMCVYATRATLGLDVDDGIVVVNCLSGASFRSRVPRDPDCLLHEPIGATHKVASGSSSSAKTLLDELGPDAQPVLWDAVVYAAQCPRCGYESAEDAAKTACPRCAATLRNRTTLELSALPGHRILKDLAVPPREILMVRRPDSVDWIELSS